VIGGSDPFYLKFGVKVTALERAQNAVSKISIIRCDNSEAVRDRMSVIINH